MTRPGRSSQQLMAKKLRKSTPAAPKPAAAARPAAGYNGPMDPALLQQLIEMMSANDVSALDLRDGSTRISLKRGPQHVAYAPSLAPQQQSYVAPSAAPSAAPAPASAPTPAAADDTAGLKPIKSPMVGTYYGSPSPDAKAFVQVGSVVNEESDVCIIEAMKVFNNIKAEVRGTIAKICVENGKPVEFGTVLFLVKP